MNLDGSFVAGQGRDGYRVLLVVFRIFEGLSVSEVQS